MNASKHMLVRCRPCGHVWSIGALPMPMADAAKAASRTQCPRCDADAKQIVMANAADAADWEKRQEQAAS